MEIYLVGGVVRDLLLGRIPKDRDHLVVGASSEDLLAMGFQKVGQSYSVYLHPETKEEHVLATTSLEEDLRRRDLTINAMAMDSDGWLTDPFGGRSDLQAQVLRHVSKFSFHEDPLRVFRVARFKCFLPEFTIAPETMELMQEVVTSDAFTSLNTERIFLELKLALSSERPSIFFETLKLVKALSHFFPELERLTGVPQRAEYHPEGDCWVHTMLVLDYAAILTKDLLVRYAALVHDLGKGVTPKEILPKHIGHEEAGVPLVKSMGKRLKVPNQWTEAAIVVAKFHLRVHRIKEMKAKTIVKMFYEMDAFRKPYLVSILARACEADDMGKFRENVTQGRLLEDFFVKVHKVSVKTDENLEGRAVGELIRAARVSKLSHFMKEQNFNVL